MKTLTRIMSVAAALSLTASIPAMATVAVTYDGPSEFFTYNGTSATLTAPGETPGSATVGAWNANGWDGAILHQSTTNLTTFSISNLPSHSFISLSFLIGLLDSWDSTNGSPAPDVLTISIDGSQVAALTTNNASGSVQDFGGGTLLAAGAQVDSNFFYTDTLLDMSSASWATFAHSASTLTIDFQVGGGGWQGGTDEAWGLDHLIVDYRGDVGTPGVPEPASWAMMIGGFALVGSAMRRRRRAISLA